MSVRAIIGLAGIALLVPVSPAHGQQRPEDLLQSGRYAEEVQGDLRAAVRVYQSIVSDFPEHRSVVATALVRLGRAYETLGRSEASAAYERVLREYAEQREPAAEARARLAVLTQPAGVTPASGMTIRKVWEGLDDYPGNNGNLALSRDARYIAFSHGRLSTPRRTGDLRLRDLVTGETRVLRMVQAAEVAGHAAVSPDGAQIAYEWSTNGFRRLRLIGTDGSGDRLLYQNSELRYIRPAHWSPDGREIVVVRALLDLAVQLAVVSVGDGSLRVLKTIHWGAIYGSWDAGFSPDGRYIAYHTFNPAGSSARDIFVIAADGSREFRVVEHPADDRFLGWADSSRILFSSDRSGSRDAWIVQVADGQPQGAPQLVKQDVADIGRVVGFSPEGAFYYKNSNSTNDVHIATLDPSTGEVLAPPRRATAGPLGRTLSPDWSPDGKFLAYLPPERGVVIRSMETGQERELPLSVGVPSALRWAPDGRSILFFGGRTGTRPPIGQGSQRLSRVDVETGEVTLMAQPGGILGRFGYGLSPDGKMFFYTRRLQSTVRIMVRNLDTAEERELHSYSAGNDFVFSSLAVSPDGGRRLFVGSFGRAAALQVIPAEGGEPRELFRVQAPDFIEGFPAWTPDGKAVIFGIGKSSDDPEEVAEANVELWRIPAEGGQPEKLGLEGALSVRVHPDGRQIAFVRSERRAEIWKMENFLPER